MGHAKGIVLPAPRILPAPLLRDVIPGCATTARSTMMDIVPLEIFRLQVESQYVKTDEPPALKKVRFIIYIVAVDNELEKRNQAFRFPQEARLRAGECDSEVPGVAKYLDRLEYLGIKG
jgi:hypothetical protein